MFPFRVSKGDLAETRAQEREVVEGVAHLRSATLQHPSRPTHHVPRRPVDLDAELAQVRGILGNLSYRVSKMLPIAEARVVEEGRKEEGRRS